MQDIRLTESNYKDVLAERDIDTGMIIRSEDYKVIEGFFTVFDKWHWEGLSGKALTMMVSQLKTTLNVERLMEKKGELLNLCYRLTGKILIPDETCSIRIERNYVYYYYDYE